VVKGDYAFWTRGDALYFRDLNAGANTVFSQDGLAGGDVAADGTVVYSRDGNIYKWLAGSVSPITATGADTFPKIDGANVIYLREAGNNTYALVENSDGVERVIDPAADRSYGYTYSVVNSNVVFTVLDRFLTRQIDLVTAARSSAVTAFGKPSDVKALAPGGDVAFSTQGVTWLQKMNDSQALAISSNRGFPVYTGGHWYFLEGNAVFQVLDGTPDSYQGPGALQISVADPQPLTAPSGGAIVAIEGSVSSYYGLKSITASVGAHSAELYASAPGAYYGNVSVSGLRGEQTITVTATDLFGHSMQTSVPLLVQ
jgi:hypothetical protein